MAGKCKISIREGHDPLNTTFEAVWLCTVQGPDGSILDESTHYSEEDAEAHAEEVVGQWEEEQEENEGKGRVAAPSPTWTVEKRSPNSEQIGQAD